MADPHPTLCFQCGHVADQQVRLNRLSDGRVCPSCRERMLTDLPPLLPSFDYGSADAQSAYDDEGREATGGEIAAESDPPAGA